VADTVLVTGGGGALKGIFDLRRPASAGAGRLGEDCGGF